MRIPGFFLICVLAAVALPATAQTSTPAHSARKSKRDRAVQATSGVQFQARKKFVLEVIQSVIALPQPDPQDRLRVLVSAARLARPLSPVMARKLAREGAEIELRLIGSGSRPEVSMMASGLADCTSAVQFVDSLPVEAVARAEQALAGVSSTCGHAALSAIQRKLEDAARHATVPPRALLAAMEASGANSPWSQQQFAALFSSLPEAQKSGADAPMLAAIYDRLAPEVDKATARAAGLKFLEWLAEMDAGAERTQAATVTTMAMKKVLGEERYDEALRSNVMASQAAQSAGRPFEIAPPEEEANLPVMKAIANQQDQSEALQQLGLPQRARQAAAYGFTAYKAGDRAAADRYFDIAFSAASELWEHRLPGQDVVAVVEEVSGAAAHVDPIAALGRAQKIQDTSAQAISMLAVAQVVLAKPDARHASPPVSTTASR